MEDFWAACRQEVVFTFSSEALVLAELLGLLAPMQLFEGKATGQRTLPVFPLFPKLTLIFLEHTLR